MNKLIVLLLLLVNTTNAFEIRSGNFGACGYAGSFDTYAMNYEIKVEHVGDTITTRSLGNYIRVANGISFTNEGWTIDTKSVEFASTKIFCTTQKAVFKYYLASLEKNGKIPDFPSGTTIEDLPTSMLLDYGIPEIKKHLLRVNAEKIVGILYKRIVDDGYLDKKDKLTKELLARENATEGLAVVLLIADNNFRIWLKKQKK